MIATGRRCRVTLLAAAACLALPALAPAAAPPLSGTTIVAKLNAERARLGVFAGITDVPEWSARCALHNRWMKLNNRLQHPEIPGTRGYSADGHWAGMHAVLSAKAGGWRAGNPWRNAPIHVGQVYDPLLRRVGTSDAFGRSCMTTWPGADVAATMLPFGTPQNDHVFTFPVDGGTAAFGQLADEVPYTPQERVGMRRRQKTGPYLFVWSYTDAWHEPGGPAIRGYDEETGQPIITAAEGDKALLGRLVGGSVVAEGGRPVRTKVIDAADVEYLASQGAGWLLPVRPLRPGRTYKATVVIDTPGERGARWRQISHSWSFETDKRALGYGPARCRGRACRFWTWPS